MRTGITGVLLTLLAHAAFADDARRQPDFTLEGHTSPVLSVAFSPDGKRLATVADDDHLRIWDLASRKELFSDKGMKQNGNQVRFTPDGKLLVAIGNNDDLRIYDLEANKRLKSIPAAGLSGGPRCIDISPDGKSIAVVGRGALRIYDLASGEQKAEYEVHKGYGTTGVAWSPDGKLIATIGTDHNANFVEAAGGKLVRTCSIVLNGEYCTFSPDGKTLWVAVSDKQLRCIDVASGEVTSAYDKGLPVRTLQVSKDGKLLVMGGPHRYPLLMALPDRKLLDPTLDSADWVKAAAISPDGQWLAGGANGGAVYMWKVQ